jgi:histidinol-phosphate aminotransferase
VPYGDDWRNDAEALAKAARREKAKLLYLANPDNPTGTFLGRAAIESLLERLPEDCLLLLDEAYYEFAPPEELADIDAEDPRVIRYRTFSKAHGMAGLRIGYAVAPREVAAAFEKIRLHFGVGRLSQLAAAASLDDPGFVAGVIAQVAEGRRDYEALARGLNLPFIASLTNFVAIDVGSEERSEAMVRRLHGMGVFVRRPGAPRLGRHVRLTVGRKEERARLAERFTEAYRALS